MPGLCLDEPMTSPGQQEPGHDPARYEPGQHEPALQGRVAAGTQTGRLEPNGRIVIDQLSKVFGSQRAVDDLSFTVEPGSVTGFLGPTGAGQTTTLRMLLGLIEPTSGSATINGVRYRALPT